MSSTEERTTVAIVGFGPIGMILAGLLANRGIDVVAIDSAAEVFPLPRAAHIDHTALRVLQQIGFVDDLLPTMVPNTALVLADEQLEPLVRIPAASRSKSGYGSSMYFYQPEFDRYLDRSVGRLPGVTVRRGLQLETFDQDAEGVTLNCRDVHNGSLRAIRADWAIGADGSRSKVRELLGAGLESLDFDEQWLVLDLVLGAAAQNLPDYALQVCDPARPWVANPVPGGRYRVEIRLHDDDDLDVVGTTDFLQPFLEPLLRGAPFTIERNALYTFHGLIADRWRDGRILLAGDAAHQMPPFLGQGMCSGVRDAANLEWKLAEVIAGRREPELLDSYQAERSPHVRSVIASAIRVGRFVSATDADEVRRRNAELRAGDLTHAPGFSLPRLEPGPLVRAGGGDLFPQPARPVGRPVLDDRLGNRMIVLSVEPLDPEATDWWRGEWNAEILTIDELGEDAEAVADWFARSGLEVAIIRPDHYLLAAGSSIAAITEDARRAGTIAA